MGTTRAPGVRILNERTKTIAATAAITLIATLAWCGALGGTFQFDDIANIVNDPATTDGSALLERLAHGVRPLTRLSYFVDAHVFGMRAIGFLAINLALHVGTSLIVFALARRRIDRFGACVAALVFALQPANGEVVAYVSGRSTGLMTLLVLSALLLHARGQRAGALIAFVLACLAKEVALVFPLLVLVWDATSGESWRRAVRTAAVYAGAAVAMAGVLLLLARYRTLLAYSGELRSVGDNVLANGRAIPVMLSLWVRPWALSADHDFDASGHVVAGLVGVLALAAVLVFATIVRERHRALALALAWPIVAVLPTSSFVAKLDLVTEKPLYLAWVGPAIALGIAVSSLRGRVARHAVGVVVIGALFAGSTWRASVWSDPIRLWQEATAAAPRKSRCWNNLGAAYQDAGRDADAVAAFERAMRLDPRNRVARANWQMAQMLCRDCR